VFIKLGKFLNQSKIKVMSVYKEMGHLVKEIKSKSKRIYNDACDYGVPVYSFNDPIMKQISIVCKDLYNLKPETERYNTGFTQTFKFNGGWPAVLEAGFEKAEIVYVSCQDKKTGIIGFVYAHPSTSKVAERQAVSYDY